MQPWRPCESSHSYTAEEALNQHLIDLIANSDAELLNALNGREITRMDGSKLTLHLAGARIDADASPRCATSCWAGW